MTQALAKPQSGQGGLYKRKRLNRENKPKLKSRYSFKIWKYKENGIRVATTAPNKNKADLINTSYYNPATKTNTVHSLAFDLDYEKASSVWKSQQKLNWEKIKSFLIKEEPAIFKSITNVAISTSGKGLGVAIAISPLEIISETRKPQNAALVLQTHIITILKSHGLGADPSARGLIRDMPNWLNPEKVVYTNDIQKRRANLDRIPVVAQLLKTTNKHTYVLGPRDHLLWYNETSERKLAALYLKLFDEFTGDVYLSSTEIKNITGLSKDTLYKFLNSNPTWVEIEKVSNVEGYRLRLLPQPKFTERVDYLLSEESTIKIKKPFYKNPNTFTPNTVSPFSSMALAEPSLVLKGERNTFLTGVCLSLKHVGVNESHAMDIIASCIEDIADHQTSRNCAMYLSIIRSVYRNKPELFGIKSYECLPKWLLEKIQSTFSKTVFPDFAKKGIGYAYHRERGNVQKSVSSPSLSILTTLPLSSSLPGSPLDKLAISEIFLNDLIIPIVPIDPIVPVFPIDPIVKTSVNDYALRAFTLSGKLPYDSVTVPLISLVPPVLTNNSDFSLDSPKDRQYDLTRVPSARVPSAGDSTVDRHLHLVKPTEALDELKEELKDELKDELKKEATATREKLKKCMTKLTKAKNRKKRAEEKAKEKAEAKGDTVEKVEKGPTRKKTVRKTKPKCEYTPVTSKASSVDHYDSQYEEEDKLRYGDDERYSSYEDREDEDEDYGDEDLSAPPVYATSFTPPRKRASYVDSREMDAEQLDMYNYLKATVEGVEWFDYMWKVNGYPQKLYEFNFDLDEMQPFFKRPIGQHRLIYQDIGTPEKIAKINKMCRDRLDLIKNCGHIFNNMAFMTFFVISESQMGMYIDIDKMSVQYIK